MTNDTTNRVYGCLIGGAIGDALGASVENWSYYQIQEVYGKVDSFSSYDHPHAEGEPGTITGDSVMRLYLSFSIAEHGGRITPEEFATTLLEHLNPDRVWITEEIAYRKLAAGMNPWDSGRCTVPAGTATSAIAPIGIINAADPQQAYQDGFNIASVTQDGVERDAAATVAAGIAEALSPTATGKEVLDVMMTHSSKQLHRALDLSIALANESETVHEFIDQFYQEYLDWKWPAVEWDREKYYEGEIFSASSIESVPAAAGILSLCSKSPNEAIIEAASFGRDSDTIGSVVGNIVGALHGATAIRDTWIEQCEESNRGFFEELHGDPDEDIEKVAYRLISALENEQQRAKDRHQTLSTLLD